jgi:hypothetical protein
VPPITFTSSILLNNVIVFCLRSLMYCTHPGANLFFRVTHVTAAAGQYRQDEQ